MSRKDRGNFGRISGPRRSSIVFCRRKALSIEYNENELKLIFDCERCKYSGRGLRVVIRV